MFRRDEFKPVKIIYIAGAGPEIGVGEICILETTRARNVVEVLLERSQRGTFKPVSFI